MELLPRQLPKFTTLKCRNAWYEKCESTIKRIVMGLRREFRLLCKRPDQGTEPNKAEQNFQPKGNAAPPFFTTIYRFYFCDLTFAQ